MNSFVCAGYDVDAVLRDVKSQLSRGHSATLAIAFCSVAMDFRRLAAQLGDLEIQVVGATSAGEIAGTSVLNEGCSVLLMDLAPSQFEVMIEETSPADGLKEAARRIGAHATDAFTEPVVITFASGVRADGEAVIHGIKEGANKPIPHFGGMAGDDLRMVETSVFTTDAVSSHGITALILDGSQIEVVGTVAHGWQPIGVEKTITSSHANTLFEIDGERAIDVYMRYISTIRPEITRVEDTTAIGVQYPLGLRRPDGSEIIRPPLFYDPEQDAVIFAGSVPVGSKVKFCIPPSVDIVDRVNEEVSGVHNVLPEADAIILVSCVARLTALNMLAEDEVIAVHDTWDVPLAGFFSYGEIGSRPGGRCDFHTESISLIALREIRA